MEFRILGPVQIHGERAGARIVPAGAKQRALLGALIVRAGQVVPSERLVEELWGACPPANAANALQAHVARLRRLLAAPVSPCGAPAGGWVQTCPPGYVLRLGSAATDAQRFERLAARAGTLAAGAPGRAADVLRQALALWRGPALHGCGQGPVCSAGAALWEESRLLAWELLFDASLRANRGAEITGELQELVAVHPLRERFYEQLMAALLGAGRRAEALGTYDRARRRLARDLGVAPGAVLRGCREAALHPPGPADAAPAPAPAPPPAEAEGVGALGAELARVRRQVELLRREQGELSARLARLTAHEPARNP
ncbi:AfsR/SARP family transcriptional regulator [Streptomyces sp. H72]